MALCVRSSCRRDHLFSATGSIVLRIPSTIFIHILKSIVLRSDRVGKALDARYFLMSFQSTVPGEKWSKENGQVLCAAKGNGAF